MFHYVKHISKLYFYMYCILLSTSYFFMIYMKRML